MFKTILMPTDGSALSEKVTGTAVQFAKEVGGKIIAISIAQTEPPPLSKDESAFSISDYEENMREFARENVEKVAAAAKAADVPCETVIAESLHPYDAIINAATEYGCDLIVMASHGRKGLSRLFLGSETQRVLTHSTIPVLVLR